MSTLCIMAKQFGKLERLDKQKIVLKNTSLTLHDNVKVPESDKHPSLLHELGNYIVGSEQLALWNTLTLKLHSLLERSNLVFC